LISSTHEDTDDAYVTDYTHQISSRITGTVEEVLVDDNWHVTAGQPLLKLDPRDYQVALEKDRASYLQAQAQLVQASAQIPLAEAQLVQVQAQADSSKANSDYLQRTFERNSQLFYQILAYQLRCKDPTTWRQHVMPAADFLVNFVSSDGYPAPYRPEERWEEQCGYSPLTIASEIAASKDHETQ
jgi:multidrug resistance efflux pump